MKIMKDNLGDRMKTYYEDRTKTFLPRRSNVSIRIDGCHFHTFTKGFQKPFEPVFMRAMAETCKDLASNIMGCKLIYTQSDEISIWLTDYDTLETESWFNNSVQKICSVSAAMTTMSFNKNFQKEVEEEKKKVGADARIKSLEKAAEVGAYFDSRCFIVPKAEVVNYFIWRQQDAIRNSVNSLAQSVFPHKELQGLNIEKTKEKLKDNKTPWENLKIREQRGICVLRDSFRIWVTDLSIPVFQNNREYISGLFPED